jgi:hypothetical protein
VNLYFLVEGTTERKIYPKWLEFLLPGFTRVLSPGDAVSSNYFLISGGGFPQLLDREVPNSAADIVNAGNYHYFFIVLDADEATIEEQRLEVQEKFDAFNIQLGDCQTEIIVQNRCIETWLLGNRGKYQQYILRTDSRQFINFYNVHNDDPELMNKPGDLSATISHYHFNYLRHLLHSQSILYSKRHPRSTSSPEYLQALQHRIQQTPTHLHSLQNFLNLCNTIHNQSNPPAA